MKQSSEEDSVANGYLFQLFVAGAEPNSATARKNLQRIRETHIKTECEVEVIDVLESYSLALERNIYLTPALIMVSPEPSVTVFGDLSDTDAVITALRLGEEK